jgi:PEP-CTERM motif
MTFHLHLHPTVAASKFRSLAGAFATAVAFAAPLMPLSAAAQSQPLPIIGGVTSIKLTSAATFAAGGVTIGVFGSTLFSPGSDGVPLVYLPVTGGSIDTASLANFGRIEHAGSGLSFSLGSVTLSFSDFVIDTAGLRISADVDAGGTDHGVIDVFSLSQSGNTAAPVALALTADAAAAFTSVLGGPDLTGFRVGLANTVPITSAVPEPATVLSMLAGLGLLGWRIGRRHAMA